MSPTGIGLGGAQLHQSISLIADVALEPIVLVAAALPLRRVRGRQGRRGLGELVVESPQSDDARQDLRAGYLPQIFMKARGLVSHGFTHRWHSQCMQPTVQRRGTRPLQRGHNFGGIFGTENSWFLIGAQVQRGQALRTQVE